MKNQQTHFATSVLTLALTLFLVGIPSSTLFALGFFTEKKVPGVYFVEFDASGLVPGAAADDQFILPSIYTINADGTVQGVDATDGGLGPLPQFLIQTPTQGVWKVVGKRSIRLRSLYFGFLRPEDDPDNDHGKLRAVSRLTANVNFDRDFNGGTGLACLKDIAVPTGVYDPGQHNPLDLPPSDCPADSEIALPFSFERLMKPTH